MDLNRLARREDGLYFLGLDFLTFFLDRKEIDGGTGVLVNHVTQIWDFNSLRLPGLSAKAENDPLDEGAAEGE